VSDSPHALIVHPLHPEGSPPVHISAVLRSLASQEGCDGDPYDQMQRAAEHIDHLERVMIRGNPLFARLPVRLQWTAHNLIAHPLSEILFQAGLVSLGDWLHDWTIPLHREGTGRG
jgi:hypothetical protein